MVWGLFLIIIKKAYTIMLVYTTTQLLAVVGRIGPLGTESASTKSCFQDFSLETVPRKGILKLASDVLV